MRAQNAGNGILGVKISKFSWVPMPLSHHAANIFPAKLSLPSQNFLRPYTSDEESALKLDGPPN